MGKHMAIAHSLTHSLTHTSRIVKVKFGAPHFVDFGQELEHSPDGKAYLVGLVHAHDQTSRTSLGDSR